MRYHFLCLQEVSLNKFVLLPFPNNQRKELHSGPCYGVEPLSLIVIAED